jgi:hypothetical protein
MKWFYNLKRTVRVIIAVVAWLPVFIFCGIIGGDIGENAENLQTWQAIVFMLLLAVGVLFTVFAVLARNREKQAERDAQAAATERATNTTQATPRADVQRPSVITMSDAAIKSPVDGGIKLPMFTKAVGVTFDNCQSCIQKSKVGDPLLIKHKPTDEYAESTDIINTRTRGRVGRINSDLAWSLLTAFDDGFVLDGEIADITGGGDGQNYGCNIKITGEHFDE